MFKLFGWPKTIDSFVTDKTTEVLGAVMFEALRRKYPDDIKYNSDSVNYATDNEFMQQKNQELWAGKEDKLFKAQDKIAKILNDILNV